MSNAAAVLAQAGILRCCVLVTCVKHRTEWNVDEHTEPTGDVNDGKGVIHERNHRAQEHPQV